MTDHISIGASLPAGIGLDAIEDPTVPVDIEEIFNGPMFNYQGEVALNPEMILHMVRRRLRDLDTQISGATDELEQNTNRAELLSRQQQVLTAIRGAVGQEGVLEDDDDFSIGGRMIKIGDTEMLASAWLESVGLDPMDFPPGTKLRKLDSEIDNIKTAAGRANSGNEMIMLRIQTLTQQRSQVIQLGTSLIKKLDEGSMSIARNI